MNTGRFLGLKATFDEDNHLKSIVKPYDMNFITREYTNITEDEEDYAPRKVSARTSDEPQYMLGDQSRWHRGVNPFPAKAKRAARR